MLIFKELTLEDKKDLDRLLEKVQPENSDFTFSNFFMWSGTYALTVSYLRELDYYLLLAKPPKWKPFFFAPIGDWTDMTKLKAVIEMMQQVAKDQGFQFFMRRVPERFYEKLKQLFPGLRQREDRNTFDYVYTSESLNKLAGRKLHSKRNQLNQFLRKYDWSYQTMDRELAAKCLQLETPWFNLRQRGDQETEAMYQLMHQFESLQLKGGVILVNNQIQAITVGERLNHDTAVIHIEKGNTEFDGIYAAINQQFVNHEWLDMTYINREEDMGLDGLRQVKLSYQPEQLVKKLNIY